MSIKRLMVLGVCAVLIALGVYQVQKVEPLLQYTLLAPQVSEQTTESEDRQESETLQMLRSLQDVSSAWNGILSHYAVTTERAFVRLEGKGGAAATASLSGEYGSSHALPLRLMSSGRNFYEEELAQGAHVIVLDEQLAIALFRVGDPIGRTVVMEDTEYTVVGVARHTRGAGEQEEYGAYVPLLALDSRRMQMDTLTVWAKPVEGVGAPGKFKTDMEAWQPGGNYYSLSKERTRALLPVWLLLTVCLMMCVFRAFGAFGGFVQYLLRDYRRRLETRFAVQMAPRLIGYTFACALALFMCIGLFYAWTLLALRPVNVFPEWIPAVPVEISEIMKTWWQNVLSDCTLVEVRTGEVNTLRMWHAVLRLPCLLAGGVFLEGFGKRRRSKKDDRAADDAPA